MTKQIFTKILNKIWQRKNELYTLSVCYPKGSIFFTLISLSLFVFLLTICSTAPFFPIILIPFILLLYFYLISGIYIFCDKVSFTECSFDKKKLNPWIISCFVFILYLFLLYKNGIVRSPDTDEQWNQVIAGEFDDWHPVIHTFSIYLLYKIIPKEWFILACFIGFFSILCGWLVKTLQDLHFRKKYIIVISLFLILSPCSMFASRVLWKDSEFALAILYLSVTMIHLWYSDGEWILHRKHFLPTAFVVVYAAFVRHNGIFFVIPFLLFLPILSKSKQGRNKLLLVSFLLFICLGSYIAGRTYLISQKIIKNNSLQTFGESVGLPMSMISEAFVKNPEKMPQEATNFLLKIAPYEKWKEYYAGDFNSVKFSTLPYSRRVFNEITPKDFAILFLKTVISCPRACIGAFLRVSSLGWDPFLRTSVYIGHSDFGFLQKLFEKIGISWLFFSSGFYTLLLIIFWGYSFLKTGFRSFFMVVPFVAYTYGTSLLLTGFDHRFFWAIIIASPCIVLTLMDSNRIYKKQLTEK